MNISYNWLKNYINTPDDASEVSDILTSIGLEVGKVEEIEPVKGGLKGLVVGEVLTCRAHENSDHLHVTTVNVGAAEALQIVCGAPNVSAGQKVIVATIGATLYSGNDSFTIKRSKIRGVESFGMICAEDEIGVGASHAGIIVLPAEAEVGTPAKDYYNIQSDSILEIDITPNRIDAASHIGVARDMVAYYSVRKPQIKLQLPDIKNFRVENNSLKIPVEIKNSQLCPRYTSVTISDMKIEESPEWLKNRLLAIGQRPINNVVDVTNFVLHELGHPLHAFDADKIVGGKVVVQTVPEGTKFTTLDGIERTLNGSELMICDTEKPMCIGGVFGGIASGVTGNTQRVFLESAYFNPVSIRKTARYHGLNTDASFRYERGADPNITVFALKRAAMLICELTGGKISGEISDIYIAEIQPFNVNLNFQKIKDLTGVDIDREVVETILKSLEIKILEANEAMYKLQVPPYRVDVQRDVDVIEDILRIYGFNNVEITTSVKSAIQYSGKPNRHRLQQLVSEQLTAQGFNEILNNSLTKEAYYVGLTSFPSANCVKLLNPLSSDLNVMRQTLLFGGLESIARNINHQNANLKFYEFGNCYHFHAEQTDKNQPLSSYSEKLHLALWLTGEKYVKNWTVKNAPASFFQLKAYVENVIKRLNINEKMLVSAEVHNDLLTKALMVTTHNAKPLAIFGTVSPEVLQQFGIEQDVYYADFNWNNLIHLSAQTQIRAQNLPKYPAVSRDLALLLDKSVKFAEIEKIAYQTEKKLLKKVTLFDVYEGNSLQADKKSYAVSFILQDEEKTLNDKQINMIMQKLQNAFETQLDAKLR
ncbi:MAG: phenylalanine--tRNA ligase subunit beta [Prevotellaceae bacterium]|jgi:phenylalanyl-tRNA synthetase beta chain|nr:phenylalanine--tRNA ligase subunit beta [Prevotellaceae bacterium]